MNYKTLLSPINRFLIIFFLNTPLVQANEIVLWNKLGSDSEVLNSQIGHNFSISLIKVDPGDPEPGIDYVSGIYGNALATLGGGNGNGGGGCLNISPDDFFPPDKTKGTVEFWFQKRIQKFVPYETPLLGIFGSQPYERGGGGVSSGSVGAAWRDGYNNSYDGLIFYIKDIEGTPHYTNDLEWNDVPVGKWIHLAFVWDLTGIKGSSDKMRIYRDGNLIAKNTDSISGIAPDTNKVKILAHHNYAIFGEPTAYMDNIIVWDYAKEDFSDRFRESPIDNNTPACENFYATYDNETLSLKALAIEFYNPITDKYTGEFSLFTGNVALQKLPGFYDFEYVGGNLIYANQISQEENCYPTYSALQGTLRLPKVVIPMVSVLPDWLLLEGPRFCYEALLQHANTQEKIFTLVESVEIPCE